MRLKCNEANDAAKVCSYRATFVIVDSQMAHSLLIFVAVIIISQKERESCKRLILSLELKRIEATTYVSCLASSNSSFLFIISETYPEH